MYAYLTNEHDFAPGRWVVIADDPQRTPICVLDQNHNILWPTNKDLIRIWNSLRSEEDSK